MPYVTCPRCHARTYTSALRMARETCPACEAPLPAPVRSRQRPRTTEDVVRDWLRTQQRAARS